MNLKFTILFAALLISCPVVFAQNSAETPNPGPRTSTEPKVLYEDGLAALEEKKYEKAIAAFQRLVDRYPLDVNFIDAHQRIAQAYLDSGKPAKAIEPYLIYVKNHYSDEYGNRARLAVTQAYLQVKKYSEARAMAEETLKKKTSVLIEQQALLMKSLVLIRQKKIADAKASLDSFTHLAEQEADHVTSDLETQVKFIFRTSQCSSSKLPKVKKSKDEAAWISYLQELSTCFKETLTQTVIPNIEHLGAAEKNEWCNSLKAKQKEITLMANDRSFNTKINEVFDDVKLMAKEKSKSLLGCF